MTRRNTKRQSFDLSSLSHKVASGCLLTFWPQLDNSCRTVVKHRQRSTASSRHSGIYAFLHILKKGWLWRCAWHHQQYKLDTSRNHLTLMTRKLAWRGLASSNRLNIQSLQWTTYIVAISEVVIYLKRSWFTTNPLMFILHVVKYWFPISVSSIHNFFGSRNKLFSLLWCLECIIILYHLSILSFLLRGSLRTWHNMCFSGSICLSNVVHLQITARFQWRWNTACLHSVWRYQGDYELSNKANCVRRICKLRRIQ